MVCFPDSMMTWYRIVTDGNVTRSMGGHIAGASFPDSIGQEIECGEKIYRSGANGAYLSRVTNTNI